MMRFGIDYVKPGMIVATPIINKNNSMILNSNVILTDRIIEGLKKNDIEYIDINLTKEQESAYIADQGVQSTISKQLNDDTKNSIRNFNTAEIIKNAQLMTTSIIGTDKFKYSLSEYKQSADIFSHSTRTAAFAVLVAKFYNDSIDSTEKLDLQSIAIAAMLHDIGKLCKNETILNKVLAIPTVLNQKYPIVNNFSLNKYDDEYSSIYSYLLLSRNPLLKPDIKMMVLLSNENENGQGLLQPGKMYTDSKQNFVIGSKIIRICSMYDDELKQTIDENKPLENISAKLDYYAANNIINENLEKLFIEHVPLYSNGVKVKLSDGRYAIIEESFHGRLFICRPIVRTIPDGEMIDLRSSLNVTIQEICNDEISFLEIVNRQIETMEQELSEKNKNF